MIYYLGAFMVGVYANSVGCLCTHDNEVTYGMRVAQIATTIRINDCKDLFIKFICMNYYYAIDNNLSN